MAYRGQESIAAKGGSPGANIETNLKVARAALEDTELNEEELVVSLNVKSLYTNVPVDQAHEIAFNELYSSDEFPEVLRSTMKSLLRLAVTNVHFKCNKMWCTESVGLAMGASLVAMLANLWMNCFENSKSKKPRYHWHGIKEHAGNCMDLFLYCRKSYDRGHTGVEIIQEVYGWHSVHCQKGPSRFTLRMQILIKKTYIPLLRHRMVVWTWRS